MSRETLRLILAISLMFIVSLTLRGAQAADSELSEANPGKTTTLYVDQNSLSLLEDGSNEHPFRTIGAAVTVAGDNADIFVRPGEYVETLYLVAPVRLHGEGDFTNLIVRAGKLAAVTFRATGLIEGFRISFSGDISLDDNPPLGIWILDPAARVEIRNVTFENLMSGIEANSSATVIVENSKFLGNYHGLAATNNPGKITATGNRMENGVFGVVCSECEMELNENTITGNEIGFMLAIRDPEYSSYIVALTGNTITGNKKRGIWLHQAGLVANGTIDLGGGGRSKGGNTIGDNGEFDVLNQSGAIIHAKGNTWLTKHVTAVSVITQ